MAAWNSILRVAHYPTSDSWFWIMIRYIKHSLRDYLLRRFNLPQRGCGLPISLWNNLPPSKPLTVVDVGAHDGAFMKSIQTFRDVRHGVLIEPIPAKAALLRQRFDPLQYEVWECVLADRRGTLTLELNEAAATSSVLKIDRTAPELAQVRLGLPKYLERESHTLDDLVRKSGLEWIDLLKLDVQGFEDRVLKGGTGALQKTSFIWTEVSFLALYEHSCVFSEIHELLRNKGFKLLELEPAFRGPDSELLQADALYGKKTS